VEQPDLREQDRVVFGVGLLLIGGDKTGNANWYEENVSKADKIYGQHLRELERDKGKDESGSRRP